MRKPEPQWLVNPEVYFQIAMRSAWSFCIIFILKNVVSISSPVLSFKLYSFLIINDWVTSNSSYRAMFLSFWWLLGYRSLSGSAGTVSSAITEVFQLLDKEGSFRTRFQNLFWWLEPLLGLSVLRFTLQDSIQYLVLPKSILNPKYPHNHV